MYYTHTKKKLCKCHSLKSYYHVIAEFYLSLSLTTFSQKPDGEEENESQSIR